MQMNNLGEIDTAAQASDEHFRHANPDGDGRQQERLRIENTSRQAELQRAARINLLGEMAAGLAHELNQPLAGIIYVLTGAANRAKRGELTNSQMLEALQAAIANAHRAAAIITRVRAMVDKRTPKKTILQLNEIAAEVMDLSAPEAARVGVRLMLELDSRLPGVSGDRVQLEQVLLNLVKNGIDAVLERGGSHREVMIATRRHDEGTVEVSVSDTGGGLRRETMARMFEPFYTTKEYGVGLGLAICQSIVDSHGGRICAENREAGGATLRFTLPVGGCD